MIKANELRIGNWVKQGEIDSIECVGEDQHFEGWINGSRYEDIEPIPIEPEILEKAGCKQGEDKNMWRNSQGVWLTQAASGRWFINGFRSGYYIDYLHQYQNAVFALTGEELQIAL